MSTPTPQEFDKLPRLDVVPASDAERWRSLSRDEKELYAEEHKLGDRIVDFVTANGRSQIWYPTSSADDYDVLELVDGQLQAVAGAIVAAVEAQEEARP